VSLLSLDEILRVAVGSRASDIHLSPGAPALARVDSELTPVLCVCVPMIVCNRSLPEPPLLNRWSMRVVKTYNSFAIANADEHKPITNAMRAVRGWLRPPDRELDTIAISMLEAGSIK